MISGASAQSLYSRARPTAIADLGLADTHNTSVGQSRLVKNMTKTILVFDFSKCSGPEVGITDPTKRSGDPFACSHRRWTTYYQPSGRFYSKWSILCKVRPFPTSCFSQGQSRSRAPPHLAWCSDAPICVKVPTIQNHQGCMQPAVTMDSKCNELKQSPRPSLSWGALAFQVVVDNMKVRFPVMISNFLQL